MDELNYFIKKHFFVIIISFLVIILIMLIYIMLVIPEESASCLSSPIDYYINKYNYSGCYCTPRF